ncbi:conjugal transfer protein TrbL family protein [Oenococcus oeni]|uniref:conjugal transfer protein TrbL family protein n=1 Tax=Oenococcus oeni TaxID=1247 RepID=UPI0008F8DD66|nr:conjugal transfer protein TrbL family protein [Oenococcus oeni]OIL25990.1 conjugal transfer protein [Oenococcus oeni]OLQ44513.1 conjugal transfer protein [Oenococcus oeni]
MKSLYFHPVLASFLGDKISGAINEWLKGVFSGAMNGITSWCRAIFDQIGQHETVLDQWYAIFLTFATSLVVVVVLGRIVGTLLKEADESTDVTWANIVMDSLKSAAAIPVMVFLQGFLLKAIVFPLGKFMFSMNSKYTASMITGSKNIGGTLAIGSIMSLILLGFFAIVTVFFFFKMCIFMADMAWFYLTIPFVAISIATETWDYSGTWWKKLIYLNASMLSQVLSMTLCVWGVTHWGSNGIGAFALSIGMGWLVLHTPKAIEDFWSSTGATKGGLAGAMRMLKNRMKH